MAIGAGDFLYLLCCGDERVELAFDVLRQRIDGLAVGERDGQIRRAEKKPSMPGVAMIASKFCSAVRVSIMASVTI